MTTDHERLRAATTPAHALSDGAFEGRDLTGIDLSRRRLAFLSLRGAILDGADLRGAVLDHVDLTGASLRGARLGGARVHAASAARAQLQDVDADASSWTEVDLTGADLSNGRWRGAIVRGCNLERAVVDGADLAGAYLTYSNCDGASLRGCLLEGANTLASTFAGCELEGARRFTTCRELVVELLGREIHDDFERACLVGVVQLRRRWCYPEWKQFLATQPKISALALSIFRRYPASGLLAALRASREVAATPAPAP